MVTLNSELITKSISDYEQSLRAAARILYLYNDFSSFVDTMQSAIDRNLNQAWMAGAASCGIAEDELTQDEFNALATMVTNNWAYITSLAAFITTQRVNNQPFSSLSPRLNLWANRWREAYNQAKTMACGNQKLEWELGPTEHCSSCSSLAGKVKRASYWEEKGIRPQGSNLECGGWNCQCRLSPTDAPLSRGPLPSI